VGEHDPGVVACGLTAVVAVCGGDRPDLDKQVLVSGGEPPGAVPAGRPGLTGSGAGKRCPTRRVVAIGFAPFHQSGAAMPRPRALPGRSRLAGRGGSDRARPTRSLVLVASAFDFSDHKAAAYAPQMTLEMYLAFPEDASKLIEVVDGWIVRCESAEPSHQAIQLNLLIAIREAAGLRDRAKQSSHRVLGDMDVLIADSPKLHFRRPDVVVYRCIDDDRGRWGRKPIAADCLIAVEIVSADSITTDIRDKRAEYAAGIPHYWIVRMTDNNGPAISVERLCSPRTASTPGKGSRSEAVTSTPSRPLAHSRSDSPGKR